MYACLLSSRQHHRMNPMFKNVIVDSRFGQNVRIPTNKSCALNGLSDYVRFDMGSFRLNSIKIRILLHVITPRGESCAATRKSILQK